MTKIEAEELAAILSNKCVQKALGIIKEEAKERDSLLGLDLNSREGLGKAQERQGEIRGTNRTLERLAELSIYEPEE